MWQKLGSSQLVTVGEKILRKILKPQRTEAVSYRRNVTQNFTSRQKRPQTPSVKEDQCYLKLMCRMNSESAQSDSEVLWGQKSYSALVFGTDRLKRTKVRDEEGIKGLEVNIRLRIETPRTRYVWVLSTDQGPELAWTTVGLNEREEYYIILYARKM